MSKTPKSGPMSTDIPVLPPIPLSSPSQDGPRKNSTKGKGRESIPTERDPALPISHEPNGHQKVVAHRFLSSGEWAVIAGGIGGVKDGESHKPAHPTHWLWPPLGMPPGLYREVVSHKYRFYFLFHLTSVLRLTLLILQLCIGAALTALGSMSLKDGKPITILAAINTLIAGFLALLHNSGLPDRYRNDMAGFEEIEDHIKEVLNSSIAPAGQTADQVLAECFDLFRQAKATVAVNMPASYASKQILSAKKLAKTGSQPSTNSGSLTANRNAEGSRLNGGPL